MLTQQISLINLHRRLIHMPNFQLTKPINAMWTKTENTESEKKHHHRIIIIISTYHTLAYRSKEHHRIITDSPTSEKRCVTLSVSGKRKKAQKTHKHKVKKTKLKRAKKTATLELQQKRKKEGDEVWNLLTIYLITYTS